MKIAVLNEQGNPRQVTIQEVVERLNHRLTVLQEPINSAAGAIANEFGGEHLQEGNVLLFNFSGVPSDSIDVAAAVA